MLQVFFIEIFRILPYIHILYLIIYKSKQYWKSAIWLPSLSGRDDTMHDTLDNDNDNDYRCCVGCRKKSETVIQLTHGNNLTCRSIMLSTVVCACQTLKLPHCPFPLDPLSPILPLSHSLAPIYSCDMQSALMRIHIILCVCNFSLINFI